MHRKSPQRGFKLRRTDSLCLLERLETRQLLNADMNLLVDTALENLLSGDEQALKLFDDLVHVLQPHDHEHESESIVYSEPTNWNLSPLLGEDVTLDLPGLQTVVDTLLENEAIQHTQFHQSGGCNCPGCLCSPQIVDTMAYDEYGPLNEQPLAAGSPYILYLDFDGEASVNGRSGDSWLYSYNASVPAYDLSQYGWGGQEDLSAQYIAAFVAEDYAAYNVQVVTSKPTGGSFTTIFVGGTNDWFQAGSGVIGVATFDVGNVRASNYGFAFTEEMNTYKNYSGGSLLQFSEYVANLISHEAGHTYGADHINDTSAIMNPYLAINPARTMFGSGTINGSSGTQDTQTLFGSNLGYLNSPDDAGDTTSASTPISTGSVLEGILERRDDIDVFHFTAGSTGSLDIALTTSDYHNLDAVLQVVDSDGITLLTSADDVGDSLDPSVTVATVSGQTYYVLVSSSGSDSSGSYSVSFGGISSWEPDATLSQGASDADWLQYNPFGDYSLVEAIAGGAGSRLYGLALDSGGSVSLTVDSSSDANGYIALYDSSGSLLNWSLVQSQATEQLQQTIAAHDATYVLIGAISETEDFSYSLTIDAPEQTSENVTPSVAGIVGLDGSITADDTDFIRFVAPDNVLGTGTITLTPTAGWDGRLRVYNDTGTLLSQADAGGTGSAEVITLSQVAAGSIYLVRIDAKNPEQSGNYDLDIALEVPPLEPELTVFDGSGDANDKQVEIASPTVGHPSTELIILTNTGTESLRIIEFQYGSAITVTPVTQGIGLTNIDLQPDQSAVFSVDVTPTNLGIFSETLLVSSTDPDAPFQVITLTGSAHTPEGEIALSGNGVVGTDWNLGSLQRDVASQHTLTITNDGHDTLTIGSITASSGFTVGNHNGTTVAPGQTLDVTVDVTPELRGQLDGTLTIVSDALGGDVTVDLSAQVLGGVINVSEDSQTPNDLNVNFGAVHVSDTAWETITLENVGDGPLIITDITPSDGFVLSAQFALSEPITLGVDEILAVPVGFTPYSLESSSGTLTIQTDDPEAPSTTVVLAGLPQGGLLEIAPGASVSEGVLDMGARQTDALFLTTAWTVTNQGNLPVTLTLDDGNSPEFAFFNNSTLTLAADESGTITLSFLSSAALEHDTQLQLTSDDILQSEASLTVQVDAYALIDSRTPYRFTDHTGDQVMVRLSGQGRAELRLGQTGQPDIEEIILSNTDNRSMLTISTARNDRTSLGSLQADSDLKAIRAQRVDLQDQGIDIDGTLDMLLLGNVIGGADVSFSSERGVLIKLEQITGDSQIDVDGEVKLLQAESMLDGDVSFDRARTVRINTLLGADVTAQNGSIGNLQVRNGNLTGQVTASDSITTILVGTGDLSGSVSTENELRRVVVNRGTLSGRLESDIVSQVLANTLNQADIEAHEELGRVTIRGDMIDSRIVVGHDADAPGGSESSQPEADAYLRALLVKGSFSGSTVAVGVSPDEFGSYLDGQAYNQSGRIGKVVLRQIDTEQATDEFGLIARDGWDRIQIGKTRVTDDFQLEQFLVKDLLG